MSWQSQGLSNYYPIWSKVRYDRSSIGARIFSAFSEMFSNYAETLHDIRDTVYLTSRWVTPPELYSIALDEADYIQTSETAPGVLKYIYPTTVTGYFGTTGHTLERVAEYADFLRNVPDDLEQTDIASITTPVIWDSATPGTINTIEWPGNLYISVAGSTSYTDPRRKEDREASGYHTVTIIGEDINGNSQTEVIDIPDDGIYITRRVWRSIDTVLTEGFDGQVLVEQIPSSWMNFSDRRHRIVFESYEGPLEIALEADGTTSALVFTAPAFTRGAVYRNSTSTRSVNDPIDEVPVYLLDSAGNQTDVSSFWLEPWNKHIYALDTSGVLRIYENKMPAFRPQDDSDTYESYIRLIPVSQYVRLNKTGKLFTNFYRPRFNIKSVTIQRTSPSGVVEYLQADKTWATTAYSFPGKGFETDTAEASWNDFVFETIYNEIGQWDYLLTCKTPFDTTQYVTSVMVASWKPKVEISTGILNGRVFTDWTGSTCIYDGTSLRRYKNRYYKYFAYVRGQTLYMLTEFDSVEVTY